MAFVPCVFCPAWYPTAIAPENWLFVPALNPIAIEPVPCCV